MNLKNFFSFVEKRLARLPLIEKPKKPLFYSLLANLETLHSDFIKSDWERDPSKKLFLTLLHDFQKSNLKVRTSKRAKKVIKSEIPFSENSNTASVTKD